MGNTDKTKGQLIKEVEALRQRMAELAKSDAERRRDEKALQRSKEKYCHLFNDLNDAAFLADVETGMIIETNRQGVALLGRSRHEIVGMHQPELHPPGKADEYRQRFNRHIVEEHAADYDGEVIRKDGVVVPVTISASILNIGGQRLILGLFRDITESKKAEEALRESERRYRLLAENATDVIWTVDMNMCLTYISPSVTRLLGYSVEEAMAKAMEEVFTPASFEVAMKTLAEELAIENMEQKDLRRSRTLELELNRKDGSIVPVEINCSFLRKPDGQPVEILVIARDVTKRKQMEEQLIIADRLVSIGELAAGIAHELNNPLTSVIGFSQLLLGRNIADDDKKDVEIIYSEAQRAAQVVKGLLTFARRHPPAKELVDVNIIIDKVLALRAYEHKVSNIEINIQSASDLPEIMADHFQLQQVFFNIVINAEHFMIEAHGRGTLTITTERTGETVITSFTDDGPGIDKGNLGHLFDPFFSTKEVGKGTGLGLSICHGIITEHNGRIYAESQLGKGATFVVELPITNHCRKEKWSGKL